VIARLLPSLALLALLSSCAAPLNFTDPRAPRYAGRPLAAKIPATPDSLRVVTFNLKFAVEVDRAIALFTADPAMRAADVILLQEMDVVGTRRIAHALGTHYVYYPATINPLTNRPFGNAILSRWPIEDDRKILLPHLGRFARTQRIAVAGTIRVGDRALRVYSVHLATGIEGKGSWKRDQALAIVEDANAAHAEGVIIGGDLNSERVGRVFDASGYHWVTRALPATTSLLSLDHVFLRGLSLTSPAARGVVTDNHGASDHYPLWVTVDLRNLGAARD
jgi:endonuclease/exonuclease/phosphatase family metal-dependent hydrolase